MKKDKLIELIDALAYQIDRHDLIGIYAYMLQNKYKPKERSEFISLVLKDSKQDCQKFINNVDFWDIEDNDNLLITPLENVVIPWHIDINYTPKIALALGGIFRNGLTISATRLGSRFLDGADVTGDVHIEEGCKELWSVSLRFKSTGGCSLYLPNTLTKIDITALPTNEYEPIKIYFSGTRKQLTNCIFKPHEIASSYVDRRAAYQVICSDGIWAGLDKSTWDVV